uniref:Ig-like domain-containing protein n=1 Tax=Amazona collaria TaxID=241587 RepID=A0A8B9FFX8_9PSIT
VPPTITLYPPSREDFQGPYRNATLLCHVQGPRAPSIQWLRNGLGLHDDATTETLANGGLPVTNSRLVVTEAEWTSGAIYTCQVDGEMRNISKALECGCESIGGGDGPWGWGAIILKESLWGWDKVAPGRWPQEWDRGDTFTCKVTHPELLFPTQATLQKAAVSDAKAPSLFVFPPPPEQLSMRESATITCLVKGFNPPDLFIQWLRNGDPIPASNYATLPALTVPAEDWSSGNVFTCLVGHEHIPMQVMQRSVDKGSGKPTAVNVSLVLSDAASSCY